MKTFSITFLSLVAFAQFSSAAIASSSDLSISVTVNPETAVIGDEIICNCVVTNNGPDATMAMRFHLRKMRSQRRR